MKPDPDEPIDIHKAFEEGTLIDEAMNEAVEDAVRRHREAGLPMVIWRDGKIQYVSPFDGSVVNPP